MCFSAISGSGPAYSLNCCMSTLRLVHYALLLTPACWKSNNTNERFMAFAPSLALDPTRDYVIIVPSFVLQIWPTLSRKMCLTILKCSTLRYDSQIIDCNYRFVAILFCFVFVSFTHVLFSSGTSMEQPQFRSFRQKTANQ